MTDFGRRISPVAAIFSGSSAYSQQSRRHLVLTYAVTLEYADILQRSLRDAGQRLHSEERLVSGNQYIWKSQQAQKYVILYHLIR